MSTTTKATTNSKPDITKQSSPHVHTRQQSKSLSMIGKVEILTQKQKYPYKQVSLLINNPSVIKQIINDTNCKILITNNNNNNQHKMIEITLSGTSDEIFNAHKHINYIRSHGKLKLHVRKLRKARKLNNWNLDVSDPSMLSIVHNIISSPSVSPINWAIFQFIDSKNDINTKILSISKYGNNGITELQSCLSSIYTFSYVLIRFDYGIDIAKHQIILIIWSPSTSYTNIIPILRHKSLIKNVCNSTHEITISIHSYLHYSWILSELHSRGLVDEILLRVSTRSTLIIDKIFVSKNTKLSSLRNILSKKYNILLKYLQITHVIHTMKRSNSFNKPGDTEILLTLNDNNKHLYQLNINHGARIYVNNIQNTCNTNGTQNTSTFIAAERTAQFDKIQKTNLDKIKIRLKLSSHIHKKKSLKSFKKKHKKNINKKYRKSINVTKKIQNIEKLYAKERTIKSKSVIIPQSQAKLLNNLPATNSTITSDNNNNIQNDDDNNKLLWNRQVSYSDNDDNKNNDNNNTAPRLHRTRSSSATLTAGLSHSISNINTDYNIRDDQHFEEYISPQIYKSVVIGTDKYKLDKDKGGDDNKTVFDDDEYNILPLPSSSSLHDDDDITNIECTLNLNDVFIVQKSIGRGKTAHVHYAIYKNSCSIALKEFKFGRLTSKILLNFHSELNTLRELNHANICRLLGHYIDPYGTHGSKQLYLAFEWLPGGCLYDVIHDNNVSIFYNDCLKMCIDIARGMQYLHSKNIIHRDLKSHNLLLDEVYRVKITDFGTAKTLDNIVGTTFTEVGTGGYCAPEVIEPPLKGYNRKVDVFSFGVLMWEIYERKNVFHQKCLRNINDLKKGKRPKILNKCPIYYKNLINNCWQFKSNKRPEFNSIVKTLLKIYKQCNNTTK